jgi:hypothetical protein
MTHVAHFDKCFSRDDTIPDPAGDEIPAPPSKRAEARGANLQSIGASVSPSTYRASLARGGGPRSRPDCG